MAKALSKQSSDPSPDERIKGFARPLRLKVTHVGAVGPVYVLRDLTAQEQAGHSVRGRTGFVKYEPFPISGGKHWQQEALDGVGRGCGAKTTLGAALGELHAKRHVDDTNANWIQCHGCDLLLPPAEFIWDDDGERVGS